MINVNFIKVKQANLLRTHVYYLTGILNFNMVRIIYSEDGDEGAQFYLWAVVFNLTCISATFVGFVIPGSLFEILMCRCMKI